MGVVVSAIFSATTHAKKKQNYFLIGLLGLLLVHILGELYIFSGVYRYAPGIAGFQLPIRMLLGPALYFYALEAMTTGSNISKKSYALAFFGPVLVIIGTLPFVLGISPDEKLALANPATRDPELWRIAKLTCLFSAVTFIVFTFAYLFAALKLHSQHRNQLMDKYSAIEQRAMEWLRVMMILWGLVWVMYTANYVATFTGIKWLSLGVVLPVLELLILVAFTNLALKQVVLTDAEKVDPTAKPQPRVSVISVEKMEEIAHKLRASMEVDELFKDEDLSLNRLSIEISISENYISETLSQCLHTNFFQFVNGYRIDEAKQLLLNSDMLVSSIAYEVGFKSKSTFNSAFKKLVGSTPTAFKNAK
ncbi:AraC family transcriptional regulator [Alteromonas sp. KUL49]|nr:AraC family transcriptional regulator [Alteromonas sp. KUL49]